MSVFHSHAGPSRFSVIRTLAVAVVLTGAFLLARPGSPQTATVSDSFPAREHAPGATVFAQPTTIQWEGYITRTLAGGRGLEIRSPQADGGYFFAYSEEGFPASASTGAVLVRGRWLGISCEYGRCAPEVDAESVQPMEAVLE